MCPCPCPVLTCSFNLRNLDKRKRKIRSASYDGCLIHSFKSWYNLTKPSLWVLKKTDIPEIVDFEDHWDKLETKLYDWVKSSLPNIVANLMQSHISKIHLKIVDGYISSAEFQRSLAERLLRYIITTSRKKMTCRMWHCDSTFWLVLDLDPCHISLWLRHSELYFTVIMCFVTTKID